jgi:hypothetical protein
MTLIIHCSVWKATQEKTKHFHVGCNKTNVKHYEWIPVPTTQCAVTVLVPQNCTTQTEMEEINNESGF